MISWLLDLLSRIGKPRPPEVVKTSEKERGSQEPLERDLSNSRIDGIGEDDIEAPTPLKIEPSPQMEEVPLYKFSRRSLGILNGKHPKHGRMSPVYPPLADVIRLSIEYSVLDMTILNSTLRTESEQREFVRKGTSKTMNSLHLPQEDGFVHAVDIGAMERGTVSWRPEVYFDIADAVQRASRELNVDVVWGGCWSRLNTNRSVDELYADYVARKRSQGRRPFFDGPHFQIR